MVPSRFLPLLLLGITQFTAAITNDFVPLSCNIQLWTAPCVSWVTTFGTGSSFTGLVQIVCGTCVLMDHPGPSLSFLSGLDIIGKLVFPNTATYKLTIYATSITVQGELDLQSTLTPVTGTPNIHIIMMGQSDTQVFRPVGENAGACPTDDLFGNCRIGRKAITVAGGKVTLRGIPADTPTWLKLFDVAGGTANNPTAVIVSSAVSGKWAPGAEILITSHTRDWFDQQVRTITSVTSVPSLASYVQLNLNASIRRPTTQKESLDYAVEVALLSRNILFEGGTEDIDGGHFWILATPNVVQVVEGIEFVHFGQQGKLGRYPIHYHFSSNAIGSKIVKNSIHQSHQRCIVIHGTDNVLVQENIAYDTKGHCFMLEDGIETGNVFNNNLGALTGTPDVIIPDNDESDMQPATFWITNPTNYFSGNIAAGSNSSGFWFELKKRGPRAALYPSPVGLRLGSFTGNVAHSNVAAKGAFRMYPGGYRPLIENKATLMNLKSYRNYGRGIYIHLCQNLDLTSSLFADNDISVDVDRAEAIGLFGLQIVGKSDSFAALLAREPNQRDICNRARGRTIGIDVHTWRPRNVDGIVTIKNINFVDFDDVMCPGVAPVIVDSETQVQGIFELFTTFENVVAMDGASAVDFCEASLAARPIDTVYLIDLDGSFRPSRVSPTAASSLVSSGTKMMTFVDSSKCTAISGRCYNYCADTCFQSVRFEVDPEGTENFSLKVCERSSPTKCVTFRGGLYYDINLIYNDIPRLFFAHVPEGTYDAVFLNGFGVEAWPSFAKMAMEPALCSATVQMTLREPPVTPSQCQQLIRNGNADASSTDPMFWLSALGGLKLLPGGGVGGSNAVSGTKQGTTQLFQYVDNRCLTTGAQFIVSADIKLLDVNGTVSTCSPSSFDCPTVGIYAESATYTDIAEVSATVGTNGFQRASGTFTVDPFVATSPAVYFYVKSTRLRQLVVDNFSVVPAIPIAAPVAAPVPLPVAPVYKAPVAAPIPVVAPVAAPVPLPVAPVYKAPVAAPIPAAAPIAPVVVPVPTYVEPPTGDSCSNWIRNSDMAFGYQGYWSGSYSSAMKNVNQTSSAIQHSSSLFSSASGGPTYNASLINTTCLTPGSTWEVSANVRLLLPIWKVGATCNLSRACPSLRVLIRNVLGTTTLVDVSSRSYTSTPWKPNAYNTLKTTFTLPSSWFGPVGTMVIGIRGYVANIRDLVLDDFYIRRI